MDCPRDRRDGAEEVVSIVAGGGVSRRGRQTFFVLASLYGVSGCVHFWWRGGGGRVYSFHAHTRLPCFLSRIGFLAFPMLARLFVEFC